MKTILEKSKKISYEELIIAVDIIKDEYKLINPSYKQLSELISKDFNVECTEYDIGNLYEPSIEENIEDLQLIYKNNL